MQISRLSMIVLATVSLSVAAGSGPAFAESIAVNARAIPLDGAAPAHVTVDALTYRGGLHLTSNDPRFGGFSALGISADGKRMLSLSDQGLSLSAQLTYDANGNLNGLSNADLGVLADLDGTPLAGKRWTDAEAMSPGVNGEIIVAFERDHRIWRYDPGVTVPKVLRPPAELLTMPPNAGIEALTLLDDGRLLAISEGSPREPVSVGWVSRAGGWDVLTYVTDDSFRPSGAATLAGGDVVVLERYYTPRAGVRIRVRRVKASQIEAGAEIAGELLATLTPPLNVDNFEGIETRTGLHGEQLIYLISDDNFNDGQRTLLMMFELRAP